jgi:hypothetical protein
MEKSVCRVAMGVGRVKGLAGGPVRGSAAVAVRTRQVTRVESHMEMFLRWPKIIPDFIKPQI